MDTQTILILLLGINLGLACWPLITPRRRGLSDAEWQYKANAWRFNSLLLIGMLSLVAAGLLYTSSPDNKMSVQEMIALLLLGCNLLVGIPISQAITLRWGGSNHKGDAEIRTKLLIASGLMTAITVALLVI